MPDGYTWKRGTRGNKYIPPLLSNQDEYCPKTHYPMYKILRNQKNTNVYMSEESCQKMRMETYQNVYTLYNKYGGPDFADFFNVNREEINELALNAFAKHIKLAPVSGLIECFSTEYRLKSNGRKRKAISFGINKVLLRKYFENVKKAEETGKPVVIPKLKRAPQKDKNIVIFGESTIKLDRGQEVKIERNALYNQFQHWCLLNGVSEKEGVLMALECLIQDYPITGLDEVGEYRVVTEFDRYSYIRPNQEQPEQRKINFDGQILALAEKIIERYNLDTENITKPFMELDTYVNNAVHLLNSNMDLKYRDPELDLERKQLERMKQESGM